MAGDPRTGNGQKTLKEQIAGWYEVAQWHSQSVWVPEVVTALAEGPTRFDVLRRRINTAPNPDRWWFHRQPKRLSATQLTRTLVAMQRDLLVVRHEDRSRVPIAVTYALSPLLRDFLSNSGPVGPVVEWLDHHDDVIETLRQRHRNQRDDHPRPHV